MRFDGFEAMSRLSRLESLEFLLSISHSEVNGYPEGMDDCSALSHPGGFQVLLDGCPYLKEILFDGTTFLKKTAGSGYWRGGISGAERTAVAAVLGDLAGEPSGDSPVRTPTASDDESE